MKLGMHENSLFAILLRSRWWISFAVGIGLFAVVRLFIADVYAVMVIGCVAAWRQLRAPNPARVAERIAALRAMSWQEFSAVLESAYRREGYAVRRLERGAADLVLERDGRCTLVAAKRWKVARAGTQPLRALSEAPGSSAPVERLYIAAGEVSEQARAYAAAHGVRVVEGAELAALLARAARS